MATMADVFLDFFFLAGNLACENGTPMWILQAGEYNDFCTKLASLTGDSSSCHGAGRAAVHQH
jgi:hypothetical protein